MKPDFHFQKARILGEFVYLEVLANDCEVFHCYTLVVHSLNVFVVYKFQSLEDVENY